MLFPSIYTVEHLYIYRPSGPYLPSLWEHDLGNIQWLEVFRPFPAVKNLYVCKDVAQCIGPALQDLVGERATDLLPALGNLVLEELQL